MSTENQEKIMTSSVWVYILSEVYKGNRLYTVGFYDPSGEFHTDSDGTKEECAARVHYLNGGN